MAYLVAVGQTTWAYVGPQTLQPWDAAPWDGGVSDLLESCPSPHLCYHAKFGR